MAAGAANLTERERKVLRLLLAGHDAKSIAARLDISVHAVNERLRKARQKLGVGSSREAARLLAAAEAVDNSLVDEKIGLGGTMTAASDDGGRNRRATGAARLSFYLIGAVVMIFLVATAVAFWAQRPPADPRPHVVSTSPAEGAVIPAGPFMLKVTFDRSMESGDFSFVRVSPDSYPDCGGTPKLSKDGRTYSMRCVAKAGHSHEIWFNRPPYMSFQSIEGAPSIPYRLRFSAR